MKFFNLKKYQWVIILIISFLAWIISFSEHSGDYAYKFGYSLGAFLITFLLTFFLIKLIICVKFSWFQWFISSFWIFFSMINIMVESIETELGSVAYFIGMIYGTIFSTILIIWLISWLIKKIIPKKISNNKTLQKSWKITKVIIVSILILFLIIPFFLPYDESDIQWKVCEILCNDYEETESYNIVVDEDNSSNVLCGCYDKNEILIDGFEIPI